MSYRNGLEQEAIARDPYSVYPNDPEHSLSYGEAGDFNSFQSWARSEILRNRQRIVYGQFFEEAAEVQLVPDERNSGRSLVHIVINKGGLVETSWLLTGLGLLSQTRLPWEKVPIEQTFRGKAAQEILRQFQEELHF